MSLARLLGETAADRFFQRYWDKSPVILTGSLDIRSLYSIDSFESRLTESALRVPMLRIVREGKTIPTSDFISQRNIGGVEVTDCVDIPAIYSLWNSGATLVLQSLHIGSPQLVDFTRKLEQDIGQPVQTNAYLTPANHRGLGVHYDTHDVFVVQIEGRKRWKVWANPVSRPPLQEERSSVQSADDVRGPLLFDGVLNEGQVLYMPRGFYHQASSLETTSLHLTFGILVFRQLDALRAVFDAVIEKLSDDASDIWRKTIDPGYREEGATIFQGLRSSVLREIDNLWSTEPLSKKFKLRQRPGNQRLFGNRSPISDLTAMEIVPHIDPLIETNDDGISLIYAGRQLDLPVEAELAIRKIIEVKRFMPKDLAEYTPQSRCALCDRLLLDGLIRRVVW